MLEMPSRSSWEMSSMTCRSFAIMSQASGTADRGCLQSLRRTGVILRMSLRGCKLSCCGEVRISVAGRAEAPHRRQCLVENLDLNHHHLGAMLMSKKITASNVKLKRAYERPAAGDGTRILIDRLWPRGVKKVNAAIDQWAKDIAPSTTLRKWFDHDPARWQEFRS